MTRLLIPVLLAALHVCGAAEADARIRFAGAPAELTLSQVSDHTVRLGLSPLDAQHKPRPATPSTVLVPFRTTEKLRVRELPAEKEVRVGQLHVKVKRQPFTVSVRRADGKLVQELTFDDTAATNAGVAFRTAAPVLGLGEGAQQFDRRGALYPMEPGWVTSWARCLSPPATRSAAEKTKSMCRVTSSPKADSERSCAYCCSSCLSSVIVSLLIRTR